MWSLMEVLLHLATTITITEDDAAPAPPVPALPTMTAAVTTGTTPGEADDTAQITFTLASASHIDTVFNYTTSIATSGTADTASNTDVEIGQSANYTISKGSTTYSLSIPVIDDDIVEGSETFTFEFNIISGATGGGSSNAFKITIADDDTADLTTAVGTALTVGEGARCGQLLVLNFPSQVNEAATITVDFELMRQVPIQPYGSGSNADYNGTTQQTM